MSVRRDEVIEQSGRRALADLIYEADQEYGRRPLNQGGPLEWRSLSYRECGVLAEAILKAGYHAVEPQPVALPKRQRRTA